MALSQLLIGLLENDIVEPSPLDSEWVYPSFIVWQNGVPRKIVDIRYLNQVTPSDHSPTPDSRDLLDSMCQFLLFCVMDIRAAYTLCVWSYYP